MRIKISKASEKEEVDSIEDEIEKSLEIEPNQLILNWKYKEVNKKLTYDIKKCIGCSLCKLVCPVDAIELGPIPEIAQNILDDSNPKLFIEEVKSGITDFKQILKELVIKIKEKNKKHIKYVNANFYIASSPIRGFLTDKMKSIIRMLYDRGRISSQTAVELMGEGLIDFRTEVYRREDEAVKGIEMIMYPPITRNDEAKGIDFPTSNPKDTEEEDIPEEKKNEIEKKNYDMAKELEGAPYKSIKDLPKNVKNSLNLELQRVYLKVFNNAYQTYENDTMASRVAWNLIKKIGRKGKDGKWYRKRKRTDGKLKKIKIERAMVEDSIAQAEDSAIKEALEIKKLENEEKKTKLLDKLLKGE